MSDKSWNFILYQNVLMKLFDIFDLISKFISKKVCQYFGNHYSVKIGRYLQCYSSLEEIFTSYINHVLTCLYNYEFIVNQLYLQVNC